MYMWTHRWPKRASLNAHRCFLIPVVESGRSSRGRPRRGASRHVFLAHLAASIRFVDNLQHPMTWQRLRGEKWDDMWYLVEFECTLGLDVFDFCVKIKVSLLKTKGDWTKTFKLLYRKQTSLESLSNGWDILYLPGCLLFVLINPLILCILYIYIHIVSFPQPKRELEKHQKGGLPQQTDHDLASCTQYVCRLVADSYKPSFATTGGRSKHPNHK